MRYRPWELCAVLSLCLLQAGSLAAQTDDPLPKVMDPRLKIELFAEHPQIVTPTGIDVDSQGRVWALESNTHFPPDGYQGHKSDRLLVMRDVNGDGRADEVTVFADGIIHAMSVAVRPLWFPVEGKKNEQGELIVPKLSVYVATRAEILLLHDDDGDLKADRKEVLVHLDTPGDYPHDGLAGFAFDATGWMCFGLGENLGAQYKIIGVDGGTLSGGGEGGSIFRCRLDGSQLSRWATGFWNPHASCIDGLGRLFSVDNDADSRPPCRLLHIIPGGDYGYRYRNGRKGLHPFTSWNGEIPGTLPMVAGTGEAPSGIVAYEADGFPAEYVGNLFVGSWGDHRIDRFQLTPRGASFQSLAEPLVVGSQNFRPVGLAVAPDGSLYFTDWVSREYKLHGKGRVWRVSSVAPRSKPAADINTFAQRSTTSLYPELSSPVLPVRRAAAYQLGQTAAGRTLLTLQVPDINKPFKSRLEALWSLARLATQAQPPEDLLLALRQLVVTLQGRNQRASFEAGFWLKDPRAQEQFPGLHEIITLATTDNRSFDAPLSSEPSRERVAAIYGMLQDNSEVFQTRLGLSAFLTRYASVDPFVQSMAIQACARVANEDEFRDLWITWQRDPQPQNERSRQIELQAIMRSPDRQGRGIPEVSPDSAEAILFARVAIALGGRARFPHQSEIVSVLLKDSLPQIRRIAVQWAAEEKMKALRPQIESLLQDENIDSDLFLATLAAIEMLDGTSPVDFDKTPPSKYVVPLVIKDSPPNLRALALRMVSPSDPALTADLFQQLLKVNDSNLHRETVRALQLSPLPEAANLLLKIAADENEELVLRADAVQGLGKTAKTADPDSAVRQLLDQLILEKEPILRAEALRALRGTAAAGRPSPALQQVATRLKNLSAVTDTLPDRDLLEQVRMALAGAQAGVLENELPQIGHPTDPQAWYIKLGTVPRRILQRQPGIQQPGAADAPGDPLTGRRVFFDMQGVGCAKCHTVDGRGGKVGPDLTTIARTMDRRKLAQSFLEPSQEISPQFVAWTFELKSGQVLTGLILSEESEKLKIGLPDGTTQDLKFEEIETRTPQRISLMPEKLVDQLTSQEVVDLLAYLESLK
ncbi:MAG: PVC-type heme-binding CxxCH protein [Planctomycetota bacterium]